MGTGGSFLRGNSKDTEDDVLGTEYDGNGVIKRIPIEVPPTRGRIGRLGGISIGKKKPQEKSSSLRSALSVDLENPEVEKIRKEYDMYRRNKENEIANYEKKERKLNQETRKLKTELHAQQKTCSNLRRERDAAREAEHQALVRAAAFETERDKIQRQFKLFRETKENEIQALLRARRSLEHKLSRAGGVTPVEDAAADTSSRTGFDGVLGGGTPGEWWTALESEPSLGSTTQLHAQGSVRGPEFAQGMLELDGPFTLHKDDWNATAASLQDVMPAIPDSLLSNVVSVYVSAARDTLPEVNLLLTKYEKKLRTLCEHEGRFLNVIHMPGEDVDGVKCIETHMESRRRRVEAANVFVAFFFESTHKFTELELNWGHMHNPGNKHAIFCFRDRTSSKGSDADMDGLKRSVVESGSLSLIDNYTDPDAGVDKAYLEIDQILRKELGVDNADPAESMLEMEGPEMLCGGSLWDPKHDFQQLEALCDARRSTCELNFEKYYERLNAHVSAPGPLPPLLITGAAGCGKSLLLAKWIELQQHRSAGNLVLYHFVGHSSSRSAQPVTMIRRLTEKLMQHVTSPPPLTCDATRLSDEFPRWLEKVSSKLPGGVVIVLDSIHSVQHAESELKWLLDPLPVDSHIIVSVDENCCAQTWLSWPTLRIEELSNKSVRELLRAELAGAGRALTEQQEARVLTHCRAAPTTVPLYVVVLAAELAKCPVEAVDKRLDKLLDTPNTTQLYVAMLDIIRHNYEAGSNNKGLMKKALQLVYASRHGVSEAELVALLPTLTWSVLAPLCDALVDRHVLVMRSGILTFRHEEARAAVREKYLSGGDDKAINSARRTLMEYFTQFQYPNEVTYRGAEELPWLQTQLDDREGLQKCMMNLCIFVKLYGLAHCDEIITYWQQVGVDKQTMAKMYTTSLQQMEHMIGQFDGTVTLPRIADVYEALGRFLRDLGLLVEALSPLQRALEIRETALDPDHPSVAQTLHQVAGLHAQQGKFSPAEALYKQALEIYSDAFGAEHYLVAKELDALAVLYQKQGKHDLAEPLHRKAVSIRRRSKAPRVVSGRVRGVDPLRRRVLQLEELAMGPDSPDLARTLNELGVLYYLQNNVDTAESFFTRALEMREAVLPPEHPDLAQSLNNLAALYHDRRQYERAEPLYQRALQLRLKNYGPDHQSVASVINHLAMLYKKMGNNEEAVPLYRQAMEIRERAFGDQHPSVATAMVNLAVLHSQQGDHASALPLYEKALLIYEESFGPNHARVAETLKNLALLKYEQGDYETAASLYKRSTEIKESASASGQVTPRRTSTYDPAAPLRSAGPNAPRALLLTQHDQ